MPRGFGKRANAPAAFVAYQDLGDPYPPFDGKPAPLIRVYRQRLSADDYVTFLDTEFSTWQKTTQVRHRT